MKRLTSAQQKGRAMRAQGRTYRGGYTREELRARKDLDASFRDELR